MCVHAFGASRLLIIKVVVTKGGLPLKTVGKLY